MTLGDWALHRKGLVKTAQGLGVAAPSPTENLFPRKMSLHVVLNHRLICRIAAFVSQRSNVYSLLA